MTHEDSPRTTTRPCLFCPSFRSPVWLLLLFLGGGFFLWKSSSNPSSPPPAPPPIQTTTSQTVGAAKLLPPALVTLYYKADWCTLCKVMEPDLRIAMAADFPERVHFLDLDLTNEKTTARAEESVAEMGLWQVYMENAVGTGYAIVVDPETMEVVARLAPGMSAAEMAAAIQAAL